MKFTKEFLKELNRIDIVHQEIVDQSRWETQYRRIFKFEEKLYETYFSRGSTEYQDTGPYDGEPDEIECDEVEAYERVVIDYRTVNDKS